MELVDRLRWRVVVGIEHEGLDYDCLTAGILDSSSASLHVVARAGLLSCPTDKIIVNAKYLIGFKGCLKGKHKNTWQNVGRFSSLSLNLLLANELFSLDPQLLLNISGAYHCVEIG